MQTIGEGIYFSKCVIGKLTLQQNLPTYMKQHQCKEINVKCETIKKYYKNIEMNIYFFLGWKKMFFL